MCNLLSGFVVPIPTFPLTLATEDKNLIITIPEPPVPADALK